MEHYEALWNITEALCIVTGPYGTLRNITEHCDVLSVRKYYQFFMHESEYISVTKYTIDTIGPMAANDPKIHPFPLRHVDPHLIHECLG